MTYRIDRHRLRQLRGDEPAQRAAGRLGINMWTLYHIEHGARVPSLAMLLRLADFYGVHPGELLTDADEAA